MLFCAQTGEGEPLKTMDLNNHILIVDDNPHIHDDFRRVLGSPREMPSAKALNDLEATIFGDENEKTKTSATTMTPTEYRLDFAHSGDEALVRVERALETEDPYALVFTDVRMTPGLDGIQLVSEIWKRAPATEVVIVTAFSDYSFEEMSAKFGATDRLFFVRKPFDSLTIKQLALTLTHKYSLGTLARKQMESLEMSRVVIDEMKDAVLWFRPDGHLFSINDTACRCLGYERSELLSKRLFDICSGFGAKNWDHQWLALRATRANLIEASFISKQGKRFPVELALSYLEYQNREFGCAVVRDITERKQAEETLLKMEERWRFLWHNVPDAIVELDLDGHIMICNRMFGQLDPDTVIGNLFMQYLPKDQRVHFSEAMTRARKTGEISDFELPVKMDGKLTWWATRIVPIQQENYCTGYLVIAADNTRRKTAEDALRLSELRLEEAQRIAQIGNWVWDFATGDLFWSDEMYRIFGYDREEGAPTLDLFFSRTHPEDRELLEMAIQRTINKGRNLKVDYRILRENDQVHHIFAKAKVELGPDRKPLRLAGTAQDVTDRRRMEDERAKLESQLKHVQKMETLGTLAGGIAHDFNNILTPILGYTEMAIANVPPGNKVREDLMHALKAANRAKDLVKQILTFSRHVEQERRPVDAALIVKEGVKLIRAWLPTTVAIRMDIDEHCGQVFADPTQIHQVLMNLCTNAYHAIGEREDGEIVIGLQPGEMTTHELAANPGVGEGHFVVLSVTDNGAGMTPSVKARVFEPFFTTKKSGDGTGLGLSVVHGIVTGHEGGIAVVSQEGEGSEFKIFLPLVAHPEEEKRLPESHINLAGKERILFVDDEEVIAEMGREMLTRMGYAVTTSSSSDDALALFKEDPGSFDLVITDQTMPHMTGAQLAKEMLAIRADLPVIMISGFSERISAEDSRAMGICDYVPKPILAVDLNKAIRRALDQASKPV